MQSVKNTIPSDIRKVPDFIKNYESTNPDVNINNLIKSTKFGVVFDEGLSFTLENCKRVEIWIWSTYLQ